MKASQVYRFRECYFVISLAETTWGWQIASAPVTRLAANVPSTELGTAVLSSLAHYREGVDHPEDVDAVTTDLARKLGKKKWSDVTDGSVGVSVELEGSLVRIIPLARDEHGGFQTISSPVTCTPNDHEVGSAVQRRLKEMGIS